MHSHPYLIQRLAAAQVGDTLWTAQRMRLADEAVGRRSGGPHRALAQPGQPPGQPDRVACRSTLRFHTAGYDCQ
jgi:hypothetical protein